MSLTIATSDEPARELGTVELPLHEYPPHPWLSWRCTRMQAPLVIPSDAWADYRWQDDADGAH